MIAKDRGRLVFEFGAIATVAFIPLVWFLVPESPDYYLTRRPADALALGRARQDINPERAKVIRERTQALKAARAGKS